MKVQVLQDDSGNNTGVFIPMNDWEIIKADYPEIMEVDASVPEWEKEVVMQRIEEIRNDKSILLPIASFFDGIDG